MTKVDNDTIALADKVERASDAFWYWIPKADRDLIVTALRAYSPDSTSDAFAMHLLDVAYRHISESDAVLSTKARANLIERARATFPSG